MKQLAIALILLCSGTAFGHTKYLLARAPITDYYVDGTAGNNASAGTSWATAWADMTNVAGSTTSVNTIHIRNMDAAITGVDWPDRTYKADTIIQYGITWVMSTEHTIGQFCTRDMWVVGPVTINSIAPAATASTNGSMINPMPIEEQGFDQLTGWYNASLNVALSMPLTLAVSSSLVSCSTQTPNIDDAAHHNSRSSVDDLAVLTCLSSTPAFGSFRPAIAGTDKAIKHNESELDYSHLGTLAIKTGYQGGDPAYWASMIERPWFDVIPHWQGAYYHPAGAMKNYGTNIANQVNQMALNLQENYSNAVKRRLLILLTQFGLDNYGVIMSGGTYCKDSWRGTGGQGNGRKFPILLASIVLDDTDMKAMWAKTGSYLYSAKPGGGNYSNTDPPSDYIRFGEDDNTCYVDAARVTVTYGQILGDNEYTYRASTAVAPTGTMTVGNHVHQNTTGAEGTITAIKDELAQIYSGYYWIRILATSGDFDVTGTYAVVDQTAGGSFTPAYRTKWSSGGTWQPDARDPYRVYWETSDIGLPEWAIAPILTPNECNKNWYTWYRGNGAIYPAQMLATLIMNARALWNNEAFFDYTDRYFSLSGLIDGYFEDAMWDAYRANYPPVWSAP
jgi:hypothetical protein